MPKATVHDIENMGFTASQFNNPTTFDGEDVGGYIYDILADIEVEVTDHVGTATYSAAVINAVSLQDRKNFVTIRKAEKFLCAANLVRLRKQFVDAAAVASRAGVDTGDAMKAFEVSAQNYATQAWNLLGKITGKSETGGIITGVVESGPYTAVL